MAFAPARRLPATLLAGMGGVALAAGLLLACAKESDEAPGAKPAVATAGPRLVRLKPEAAAAAGVEVRPVARGEFRMHR
ncbi:MAG: hypothetical protein KGL03_09365, partial [Nitrospirota bacterium]|nr:hypothetical protein [Nitrospirota bacterium]